MKTIRCKTDVADCAFRAQLSPAASIACGCAARDCAGGACVPWSCRQSLRWRQSWRRKTHAHAVTTAAAAAGRCFHASTSPPPPPPIPRLVGKYPHTLRSNQSALACPRGCSHGLGGILSLSPSLSLRPLVPPVLSFSVSLFPLSLLFLSFSLSLSFTWLLTRAGVTQPARGWYRLPVEVLVANTADTVEVRSTDLSV